jgi:hypothetical protein
MKVIVRARPKPFGGATEFISVQGRIKAMVVKYGDDNYDFVIDEGGRKSVKTFGVDNINPELVGQTIPVINDRLKFKFNEDGTIQIIEGTTNESRIMKFVDFVNESLPRQKSINQLKKLRKMTKGMDIGDRVPNMKKQGANIHFMHNPVDSGVESYEDFEKHNKKFQPGWNTQGKINPFKGEK